MPSKKAAFSVQRSEFRNTILSFAVPAILLVGALTALNARPADGDPNTQEAARLNSIGVALMNQQLTEKAEAELEQARAADPKSAIPVLNQGIALLYMQKLPEAEAALRQAGTMAPDNPRAWYNLGLTEMDEANQKGAIEDMGRVLAIDPKDADAHYFVGSLDMSLGEVNAAIGEYEAALKLNPLHCSAEFGLARALQRAGRVEEAHEHLKIFQHYTQAKISSPLSVGYGERGHYSTMEEMPLPAQTVGPMIPVKFEAKELPKPPPVGDIGTGFGGGVCSLDIFGTGHKDLIAMGAGAHAVQAWRNLGNGVFEPVPGNETGLDASGAGSACAVGDFDNDGLPDLAVALAGRVILYHNLGHGKFEDVTAKVGITQMNNPRGLTFVDFDHDGDLDLFVTGAAVEGKGGPNVMWRNNGNSTFTEWTGPTGLTGQGSTTQAMLSDINNDRAVDLVVTSDKGAPTVYLNQREGAFKAEPLYTDAGLPGTLGVAVFDFNKDGWMDVAVTHDGAPGLTLWRNVDGEKFERVPLPLPADVKGALGVTPIDVDNDGWIDLAAVLEVGKSTEIHVFRNLGPKGFEDVTAALGLDKIKVGEARSVIAADVDGDGATDLILTRSPEPPVVLRNVGGNKNHSLRIALTGLADNKTAIGTKVEVLAGGMWQKFEVAGASGYLSQGSTEIVAGLGQATKADVVRLLWPTGVPQDEIDIDATKLPGGKTGNGELALKELDRRGSSCPTLFAWDGKQYRFVSDVIGAAVVGHWVSPTATNQNDPDEWIKVDGDQLRARNGLLSLRFGEPMEEVNYIDQLRLVSVDHPAGTEVYPDERFLSERPFASGKTVAVSDARPVAGAWDDGGHDVRELLADKDHRYVRDFTNLSYAGFANLHTLTLDVGAWSPARPLRLLLDGYIEYFSASSMYAAWQAGMQPIPPRVDVEMPDGSWKRVIRDMGFPAGLPRTIVVDLTGKLPPGARKIRITTNLQIYWDRIRVDNGPDAALDVRQTEVPLAMANLAFRGYPKQIEGSTPGDLTYDYSRISATGPFLWARGVYTRYGDVTPLLEKVDNRYVIFGTGEEIDAEFSAAELPALPAGWTRDYFFYANGFVKDMDYWEEAPFTVGPMPFHAMSRYPYPANEQYPHAPGADRYWLEWNTRYESGNRRQRWEFDYRSAREVPNDKE
jgi:tetratricopeptide (TPR) repeat protein